MAGLSFSRYVKKVCGVLIIMPILALSGCGEGDGPIGIKNTAVPPLNLPPGFCDRINLTFELDCEPAEIVWFGGGQTVVIDNPDKSGINQSDKVARMQKFFDQLFGGTRLNPAQVPVDFSFGQVFKVKVWSEREVPVTFKLEESNDGTGGVPKIVTHNGGSVWEELCFDFTTGVPGNPTIGLTIIFDDGVQGGAIADVFEGDWTFYYDDITQVESCSDTPTTGIVPDVKLYDPTATPPVPADVEVTPFGSQSVINDMYADDASYSPVLAVSSGVGYGANVAQVGFIGFDPGFVTFYETLDFKVKGLPNSVLFVSLYEGGDPLRINLSSSGLSEALGDGWYQVSIQISSFNGLTTATGVVFESDNTAPMQFMMLMTDIGFGEADTNGGGDCDDGGAPDPNAIVFDDDFGAGVSFAPFGGSINDVSVDAAEAYSGTASLRVVVPSSEYTGGALVADPARDLSAYDTVTFWAKASDARTLNVAGIADDTSGSAPNSVEVTNLALTTDWQQFTITIPDPSVLTANAGLFHFAEGSDEGVYTIWFDEITYVSSGGGGGGGGTAAGELAVNGDFETGNFDDWEQFVNSGVQTISSDTPTDGGSFSAALSGNTAVGAGGTTEIKQANLGAGSLAVGDVLTIRFQVKGTFGPGGQLNVLSFTEFGGGGADLSNNTTIAGGVDDWTQYDYDVTLSGSDASGGFSLAFNPVCGLVADCVADVFIDNVSIVLN